MLKNRFSLTGAHLFRRYISDRRMQVLRIVPVASKARQAENLFCATQLLHNYPSSWNLVSQRWGNVTRCSAGGGFRAEQQTEVVRKIWFGEGLFFLDRRGV
jgi:hypothetical protein